MTKARRERSVLAKLSRREIVQNDLAEPLPGAANDCDNEDIYPSADEDQGETSHKNHSTQTLNAILQTQCAQTVLSLKRKQLFARPFLSEKQMKHFTGFSRKLFQFFVEQFGRNYLKVHPALSVEDELLLTLMKYRMNFFNTTLSNMFDIDIRTVMNVLVCWSKHLYKCFKQINFWESRCIENGQYDVIIDCTEFRIERSGDPIIQQTTYSTYYHSNTFKALIGCTERGMISFVSDIYGGCISDRVITQCSGLLDLLKDGDFVLADRGFDISDVLEEKGIHLNIPPFKLKTQLSEEDIALTRAIANRRIIVENVIGLAKKNKILSEKIVTSMWPIMNEVIYNCFMFINFKKQIK